MPPSSRAITSRSSASQASSGFICIIRLPLNQLRTELKIYPEKYSNRLASTTIAATIIDVDTAVKPQGCTNLKLRQLMRRVAQHYDAEVGKTGLKGTQYSLLSYVLKLGPIRPGDLAREMKIGPSTLTRNLRPLIDAGLLELGPGADGRS